MIIQLEEAKIRLRQIKKDLTDLAQALKISETKEKITELEKLTIDAGFWNDPQTSSLTLQEIKQYKDKVGAYDALCQKVDDAYVLAEMGIEENDESLADEVNAELAAIEQEAEKQRLSALLTGEYDEHNAILTFHPGTGGTADGGDGGTGGGEALSLFPLGEEDNQRGESLDQKADTDHKTGFHECFFHGNNSFQFFVLLQVKGG